MQVVGGERMQQVVIGYYEEATKKDIQYAPGAHGADLAGAGSFTNLVPATLSDTTDDPAGVSVGFVDSGAGTLKVITADGATITIPSGLFALNQIHRLAIKRVFTTGTTATGIYLVY
jgi:hypothetical protein